MKRFLLSLAGFATIAIIAVAGVITPDTYAQASAEYSCGTYGAGDYSTGNNCSENNNENVGAPNTGFAALMQPATAVPLGLSLLALIAGALLLVRRRKRITLGGDR